MISLVVAIMFIACAINIPTMIVYLKGLQFQINDPKCSADVNDVKKNILMTKIVQVFNTVICLVTLILCSLL